MCKSTIKSIYLEEKNPIKQARLDFFLISCELSPFIQTIEYENSYRSDHSPVVLHIKTTDFVQGRGYWKFNNSLLSDKEYIQTIKTLIIDIERQYAALVYNINEIQNIKDSEIVFQISDSLFFDTLLMEIRGKSISFSTYKKRKLKRRRKKT